MTEPLITISQKNPVVSNGTNWNLRPKIGNFKFEGENVTSPT